ncbi:MAG: manganese ABC transporter permease [Thermoflexus sp.]|uniref:metal ABC transporter permease n=1 Tax=Thermoflexus sp. TaxID=1969742 RepID=UPI00331AE528
METLLRVLLDPLQHPFMVRGLAAAVGVGMICALVGTYVVLRGMAFFGDALAHSILPGLALGYLLSGGSRDALFWWGLGTAVLAALGIGALSRGRRLKEDTAIGILFAGAFALGVVLISTSRSYAVDLTHLLFGDVLGVTDGDLVRLGIFGGLVVLAVALFYKELLVISFDPVLAVTLRLPARLFENLLLVLIAVAVVVALRTVGVALMVAMLVTPAATAYLMTHRLPAMMGVAMALAALSAVVGLYASYYTGVASGAAIVLTATALFGVVAFLQRVRHRPW